MAIHCRYRKTTASNYIAVASYIKLPNDCNYRAGTDYANHNGGCPEFFHGMYRGSNIGVDSGVGYNNGSFRIMVWSFANMFTTNSYGGPQWFSKQLNGVNMGDTIILRTYLSNNKFITRVDDANGNEIDRLEITCASSTIYNEFLKGVYINRENSLAINCIAEGNPACNDTPAVYFKNAQFYRSTLTTKTYGYIALTDANSALHHTDAYSKFTGRSADFPHYDDLGSSSMVDGYVKDTISATTNCIQKPIR